MKKTLSVLAICAALLSGCSYQKFQLDAASPSTVPTYQGTSHFVFWGIGQTKEINPREVCGARGFASVETSYSFLDGLLTGITYGIYSPRTYAVYCKPSA